MMTLKTSTDARALVALLDGLPQDVQTGILAAAVSAAAVPVQRMARALAPRESGALAKSIGIVQRKKRRATNTYAVVGPVSGYYSAGSKLKGWKSGAANPAKYAHLVEFGHVKVRPKKGTSLRKNTATVAGFVAPRPFLRPATLAAVTDSQGKFNEGFLAGVEKALKKYPAARATS